MEEIVSYIGDFGFPIIISIYLLVRIENKLEQLSQSINNLSNNIQKIRV